MLFDVVVLWTPTRPLHPPRASSQSPFCNMSNVQHSLAQSPTRFVKASRSPARLMMHDLPKNLNNIDSILDGDDGVFHPGKYH